MLNLDVVVFAASQKPVVGAGIGDLARDPVRAVDSACPDLVDVRAKRRCATLKVVHSDPHVVLGDFARLAHVGDYGDRLVLAVFGLGDQHREAQIGRVGDLDGESVVVLLFGGGLHD